MSPVPAQAKIYHITHVDNLAAIVRQGALLCDATIAVRVGPSVKIGMSEIKRRRIEEIAVTCHPGTNVGDYVPFYFCPRSVMLFLIHCANHPDLSYCGGQGPIVHLEADMHEVVAWAATEARKWAFSLSNAGSYYVEIRDQLDHINWAAVASKPTFAPPMCRKASRQSSSFTVRFHGNCSGGSGSVPQRSRHELRRC